MSVTFAMMMLKMYERDQPRMVTKVEYVPEAEVLDAVGEVIVNLPDEIYYVPIIDVCHQK
jgi:hypothetical protein